MFDIFCGLLCVIIHLLNTFYSFISFYFYHKRKKKKFIYIFFVCVFVAMIIDSYTSITLKGEELENKMLVSK